MGRLDGKVAVITGAAGGIGRTAALAFSREGAVVAAVDRDSVGVAATVDDLPGKGMSIGCDVSDEHDVERAFAEICDGAGGIDVLYTCAAVQLAADGPVSGLSVDVWQHVLGVNLTGTFLSCKYAVRPMIERGGGSIMLCASSTALTSSGAGAAAYSTSKGGVLTLMRTLAADYAKDGIRANAVIPGTTRTPLIEHLLADPERRTALEQANLLGRLATPDDLVGIAVYLASDESAFATGSVFCVDGGRTMR